MENIILGIIFMCMIVYSFHCFKEAYGNCSFDTHCSIVAIPAVMVILLGIFILMLPSIIKELGEKLWKK